MLCKDCENHGMKFLITKSNEEREIWKCMKCGYEEEFKLWKSNKEKKGEN